MSRKVVFKTYDQGQLSLLPPSYDDLAPANHPFRTVDTIIDHIDLSALEANYKGGGTSSYHPRMLIKVIIYAYLLNLYSSRKIEQALHENIHFMWISGQRRPDLTPRKTGQQIWPNTKNRKPDTLYCPMSQAMSSIGSYKKKLQRLPTEVFDINLKRTVL